MTTTKRKATGKARHFRVEFERDKHDPKWWIVQLHPESLGVHSNGRTLEEARRNVREALELAVGDAEAAAAVFDEQVNLPADALALVEKAKAKRAKAKETEQDATETQRKAAKRLTAGLGLSLRDAGELLAVSHAAVAKVLAAS